MDKRLYQPDMELCTDVPKCWRFNKKSTPKCSNCPHILKDKKAVK